MTMFALYGIRRDYHQHLIGGEFEPTDTRDLVAVFTTEEKAKSYVKKAKLKNQVRRHAFGQPKMFRKSTLLGYYDYAEIEQYSTPVEPIIDPEI